MGYRAQNREALSSYRLALALLDECQSDRLQVDPRLVIKRTDNVLTVTWRAHADTETVLLVVAGRDEQEEPAIVTFRPSGWRKLMWKCAGKIQSDAVAEAN